MKRIDKKIILEMVLYAITGVGLLAVLISMIALAVYGIAFIRSVVGG